MSKNDAMSVPRTSLRSANGRPISSESNVFSFQLSEYMLLSTRGRKIRRTEVLKQHRKGTNSVCAHGETQVSQSCARQHDERTMRLSVGSSNSGWHQTWTHSQDRKVPLSQSESIALLFQVQTLLAWLVLNLTCNSLNLVSELSAAILLCVFPCLQ